AVDVAGGRLARVVALLGQRDVGVAVAARGGRAVAVARGGVARVVALLARGHVELTIAACRCGAVGVAGGGLARAVAGFARGRVDDPAAARGGRAAGVAPGRPPAARGRLHSVVAGFVAPDPAVATPVHRALIGARIGRVALVALLAVLQDPVPTRRGLTQLVEAHARATVVPTHAALPVAAGIAAAAAVHVGLVAAHGPVAAAGGQLSGSVGPVGRALARIGGRGGADRPEGGVGGLRAAGDAGRAEDAQGDESTHGR